MNLLLSILVLAIGVEWTASPDPRTTGYVLVWGSASRVYDHSLDVGNTNFFDLSLPAGINYVSCYAYGDGGLTSDFCNEVICLQAPVHSGTNYPSPPIDAVILP